MGTTNTTLRALTAHLAIATMILASCSGGDDGSAATTGPGDDPCGYVGEAVTTAFGDATYLDAPAGECRVRIGASSVRIVVLGNGDRWPGVARAYAARGVTVTSTVHAGGTVFEAGSTGETVVTTDDLTLLLVGGSTEVRRTIAEAVAG